MKAVSPCDGGGEEEQLPLKAIQHAIANRFFGDTVRSWKRVDSGLSGAPVFCIESLAHSFALKGWPSTMETRRRLCTIHAWQEAMRMRGIRPIPSVYEWHPGRTLHEEQGFLWEWIEWKFGESLPELGMHSEPQLRAVMAVLARIHVASRDPSGQHRRSPGIQDRFLGIERRIRSFSRQKITSPVLCMELDRLRRAYQEALGMFGPELLESLRMAAGTALPNAWVLRDVWRAHVLFDGDTVSGLIDLGASRVDWPGLDWVRWVNSNLPFDALHDWKKALLTYDQERQAYGGESIFLDANDVEAQWERIRTIAKASLLLSAAYWLDRLSSDPSGRQIPLRNLGTRSGDAITLTMQNRMAEIGSQLEKWLGQPGDALSG